jgi:PAS domain S-box-containing protein
VSTTVSAGEVPRIMTDVRDAQVAFEQAAIGMAVVDFDGRFLAVNTALCELVGRSPNELLQTRWQAITHPDDVAQGEGEVRRAIRDDGRSFRLPKRYIRPDGECLWVLLTVSLITGDDGEPMYLLTQVVDITEQRKAEEELAQLASIVESSGDAILSMDLTGTIRTWNPAAQRLFGYGSDEITGRSILTMVVTERRAQVAQMLTDIRTGGSVRTFETVILRKDSSPVPVAVTLSLLFDGFGAPVGASIIARDVSVQHRMAAELDRTLGALASALDEARRSEARTRTFLSDAAHHLRNPVAGISACAESLLRGSDRQGSERLLAEIARETLHVGRLVDRLLRIARLAEGESLILLPCDLTGLCEDEVERAESMAPHLEITVSANSPAVRCLDAAAVREIVRNLLENARRHAATRVEVAITHETESVSVQVSDDGPGLRAEAVTQAFEPFVTIDECGGSGLGLTLSKALARAHGGDLTYEDASFVIRLAPGVEPTFARPQDHGNRIR